MAQKRVVTVTSDISGDAADETLTFGLDDKTYEIDLTTVEAEEIREFLAPYMSVARKTGSGGRPSPMLKAARKGKDAPSDSTRVRAWARENGVEVPGRGRIPNEVREQFAAAHGSTR